MLECTWAEFKLMSKEFREAAPSLNADELDNAWACLGLGYFNMTEKMWRYSAALLLKMEMKNYLQRERELLSDNAMDDGTLPASTAFAVKQPNLAPLNGN